MKSLVHGGVIGLVFGLGALLNMSQAPVSGGAERQRALQCEQSGDAAGAEAAWHAILKSHPSDAEANAHIGLLEARQERFEEALPYYRNALAIDPGMPGLRLNLGLSQFKTGDLKGALKNFEILLKQEPPSSPEAVRLTTLTGLARFGLGDYAAAVPHLKKAADADPQNLPFRLALAQSCLWSKQYECVLDVYKEIVTLNAESAEADMLAGQAYDEMKNDAGALEQFQAAVKADPSFPNVHFGYGYLLWRQLRFEEAKQEFKAELANNPEQAQALTFLGDTEIHLGHPEAAPSLLNQALRIDPAIAMAHLDLGIVYGDQGRNEDAVRELKAAAALTADDPNIHWRLGRLYQAAGMKAEAKVEFDKTRSLQKASDDSVFNRLHPAQAGSPQNATSGAQRVK